MNKLDGGRPRCLPPFFVPGSMICVDALLFAQPAS